MEEENLKTVSLVCHTEGCVNNGVALQLTTLTSTNQFFCGPCDQPITDITNITE